MPSPSTELVLQNSLARATALLFRIGDSLSPELNLPCAIKMEIVEYFTETGKLLQQIPSLAGGLGDSAPSAHSAESFGPELKWTPSTGSTSLENGPVRTTGSPEWLEDPSSNFSPGGIVAAPLQSTQPSRFSPTNSSFVKPFVRLSPNSEPLLICTYWTGQRIAYPISEISSFIEAPDGNGTYLYLKSKSDPDQLLNAFIDLIESLP